MYQNSKLDHLFSLPIVEQVYPSSEHEHSTPIRQSTQTSYTDKSNGTCKKDQMGDIEDT